MPQRSVRYRKQVEIVGGSSEPVSVDEGIERIKKFAAVGADRSYKNGRKRKAFDQTVELVLHLGIDPKQADQMLRGAISLPKGTGRTQRVIAFCDESMAEAAKAAGAVDAGSDELVDRVSKGWMDFDVAVSHPQLMGKVGKLGRVLGPQGKMPSPKAGTVTADVEAAVRDYSAGKLEYRNDSGGNIHLPVGKVGFDTADLKENIEAVVSHMVRIKPSASKGHYLKRACLSGTCTPSVTVSVG